MRFSGNGFYVETYDKCANCGVLLYGAAKGDARKFCGDWCASWFSAGAEERENGLPLPNAKTSYAGRTSVVDLTILDGNLASICRDMGVTVMRTAYSPIFSESLDFTCGLFDRNGEMIAVGDFCPSMIGGMPLIVKAIVQEFPLADMSEGDVIVHNDPYRGGMHTP
jgi:N-methylhydantoinase B